MIIIVGKSRTHIGQIGQSIEGDFSFYPPSQIMSRIAFIAGTYLPASCSISDYTARLHASLRDRGMESVVLTTHYAAEAAYDPHALGVVHGWRWTDLKALVKAVWDSGADALHIQYHPRLYGNRSAILLLPLLLRLSGWRSPIVTTVHEYGNWESPAISGFTNWFKQWDRQGELLLRLSDATIAIAPETKTLMQARLPNLDRRLWYVPTATNVQPIAIDRSLARRDLRQQCHWDEDAIAIAYFGFLRPGKGLETLLLAFKQVLVTQPQARLLLMGGTDDPELGDRDINMYFAQLQTRIDKLDLHRFVHVTGYVNEETASRYLTGADLGVLPNDRGVSLNSSALMALLAHGLPAIATQKTASLPATHPLFLVPPLDVTALTTAIGESIDSLAKRRQRGEASRIFNETFNWQKVTQQHLEIYQNLRISNG